MADAVDRRDGLRRRIYLGLLAVGIPSLMAVWATRRGSDPLVAWTYPPLAVSQVGVLVGLLRRRLSVQRAERTVLLGLVVVFLSEVARQVWVADGEGPHVSTLLSLNLMTMLAYVAYETRQALRVALGIVAAYVVIIAVWLLPLVLAAGGGGGDAAEYVSVAMFMLTSVGLLHVLAQTKEQAAEARSSAAALEALANTDVLTGIANRRRLHDALEEALAGPVAVVLLDVDRFKRINDTHGHVVGDDVLQAVATTIDGVAGGDGLVGRWGGEEFLVVLPTGDTERAWAVAEACRAAIADLDMPLVGPVTCSLGVAVAAPGDTPWSVLSRADGALYDAKRQGRDRVNLQDGLELPFPV